LASGLSLIVQTSLKIQYSVPAQGHPRLPVAGVSEFGAPLPARILIVDDHAVIRKVIRSLLEHLHSFQICEEARNGKEAVEQVERLKPDIVLLDINMLVMDGFNAAQQIRRVSPETKIVFLSMFDTPGVMEVARLRSDAFVSKYKAGTELFRP
jgi:DNA-binding NarL/FixJ family response regulator